LDGVRTLDRAVLLAVDLIDGCDFAGISIAHRNGVIDTPASTDAVVRRGDQLQYTYREGPCLDAIWQEETIQVPQLADERRWPTWAPQVVAELGIRSMLCLQLFTSARSLGALNLYSTTPAAFDAEDVRTATSLAANIAVAVAAAQGADDVRLASLDRIIVGQAQGILMERFALAPDRAFHVLSQVAGDQRVPLQQVASDLVLTRLTPGGERTRHELDDGDDDFLR
jgi:GAF domain-containing protein